MNRCACQSFSEQGPEFVSHLHPPEMAMPSPDRDNEIRLSEAAAPLWRRAMRPLMDLLFPPFCPLCQERMEEDDQTICAACRNGLAAVGAPRCPVCGARCAGRRRGNGCEFCPPRPIHFDSARAAVLYAGPGAEAVKALKFRARVELAAVMARKMAPVLAEELLSQRPVDWIVPVPLHFTRRLRRGFNQSELIGRELGRLAGVPLLDGALRRIRRTRQQTFLEVKERRKNVEGAFAVADSQAVLGRRLLLVDDVFTTGATCNACARVLREAGAEAVEVFTFARP